MPGLRKKQLAHFRPTHEQSENKAFRATIFGVVWAGRGGGGPNSNNIRMPWSMGPTFSRLSIAGRGVFSLTPGKHIKDMVRLQGLDIRMRCRPDALRVMPEVRIRRCERRVIEQHRPVKNRTRDTEIATIPCSVNKYIYIYIHWLNWLNVTVLCSPTGGVTCHRRSAECVCISWCCARCLAEGCFIAVCASVYMYTYIYIYVDRHKANWR